MPKKKHSPAGPSSMAFKEPSPRERINYQLDDLAHSMTKEHPRVQAIHAGIKNKLEKLADKHMGNGKASSSERKKAVHNDEDDKAMKKGKGKAGTAHKGSAPASSKLPVKHTVAKKGKKKAMA